MDVSSARYTLRYAHKQYKLERCSRFSFHFSCWSCLLIQVLTWAETAVIQLARLHICVRQVPTARQGSKVSEGSGNVVAYPLECHALLHHLGSKADELPNWITVLFEGDDRSVVRRDRSLLVGAAPLRRAFRWLLYNCWPWLEAARDLPITSDFLGHDIEETIGSYGSLCEFHGSLSNMRI